MCVAIYSVLSCEHCDIDSFQIVDLWARASKSPNKNTAVYFKITNNTGKDIKLVSVTAEEVAGSAVIHQLR